jgi:cell division septum initiation protein DivIVA
MNERLEILRDELCDLHRENEELKDEVKFLEQELHEAQEVLDSIDEILIDELGENLGTRIYNRIFGLD